MNTKALFKFLTELEENNNKEWFDANKPTYLHLKAEFEDFVTEIIEEMSSIDPTLSGLTSKKSIYRIYKDVRFSKDKTPYKTNFGAAIAKNGRTSGSAGYYIHLQPGGSMIGGGLYHPPADSINAVRQEIDYNTTDFKNIVENKTYLETYGELWDGDQLKTAPKGYPKDHPEIKYLRNRSFVSMHAINDKEVFAGNLKDYTIDKLKQIKPFIDFLNTALDN